MSVTRGIPPSLTSETENRKSQVYKGFARPADAPPPAIAPFDAEQAKKHQAAWAQHLGVPVESENSIGIKFILIPPGEFDMGSTEADVAKLLNEAIAKNLPDWYIQYVPAEAPKHCVRITKPF